MTQPQLIALFLTVIPLLYVVAVKTKIPVQLQDEKVKEIQRREQKGQKKRRNPLYR